MKTRRTRQVGYLTLAIALTGLFAMAPAASAQYPDARSTNRRGRMATRSYDRIRQYARQLDELAQEANRQAQAQQAGYRGIRRDTKFLREISQFANRASQFRARVESYQTRPWNIDEEIAVLLRHARDVEQRIQKARFVDRRTVSDWNRAVSLLNQMATEYQAGIGGNRYPDGDNRRDQYPNDPYPSNGDYRGDRMSRSELRSEVNQLLQEAQNAHDELTRRTGTVSREVANEWNGIVQVLNRMRDLAV